MALIFPQSAAERDQWILEKRPPRAAISPREPYAFFVEDECGPNGETERVAAIFLTNRECPFRCTMCDLWRNTLTESVPSGAILAQMDHAMSRLPPATTVKLYNSGSFFDPRAIPPEDYKAIANRVQSFERVIVECHPAFVNERCLEFCEMIQGRLEIAIGLETAHPATLEKLNKRMTLEQFSSTAEFLRSHQMDLRVFILVQPPFMAPTESLYWANRSLDFAFDCEATAATLIPTRAGNGATDALLASGEFIPPRLDLLEDAAAYGLSLQRGRVFADLWDLKPDGECSHCSPSRLRRLQDMNLRQSLASPVLCSACGNPSHDIP